MSNKDYSEAVDARLTAALDTANYRITLTNQRNNARLKLAQSLTYATSGGIFNISPTLISFVHSLISMGRNSAVILDARENPIMIDNLVKFNDDIISKYYENHNEFLVEMTSLQKARNTAKVVE